MDDTFSPDRLQKIFTLLHDPRFLKFEAEQEAPTIFNAVGRTHTETWHSALLAWLLDPQGSHGLGLYPLQRLLLLLSRSDSPVIVERKLRPAELLAMGDLTEANVRPNERELTEVSVDKVGKFDVYIMHMSLPPWQEVRLLIEVKVDAPIAQAQCRKYMQYIRDHEAKNIHIMPVFVAPESHFVGSPEKLFGDPEWMPVGFQALYDEIIEPCLSHFSITQFGTYTLTEYVKTLKYRRKGNPLIVAQSDRDLISNLLAQHRPAIDALFEILSQQSSEYDEGALQSQSGKNNIKIKIGEWHTEQSSIAKLYRAVLEHLYDLGKLQTLELPIPSGTKRYMIAKEPVHPFGNEFLNPAGYNGYYMEANKSRGTGLSDLAKVVRMCGLSMEEVK